MHHRWTEGVAFGDGHVLYMRELAANTRLRPNYFQMLAYVHLPILLLGEGEGVRDGVGFINVLALLQQFRGKSLGGKRTAVFLHAAVGERWRRALPFPFSPPISLLGCEGHWSTNSTRSSLWTKSIDIAVISGAWPFYV